MSGQPWLRHPVDGTETQRVDVEIAAHRRYLKIQEWVAEGKIKVMYINITQNRADMFTKPLEREVFERHASAIMGWKIGKPVYGMAQAGRVRAPKARQVAKGYPGGGVTFDGTTAPGSRWLPVSRA